MNFSLIGRFFIFIFLLVTLASCTRPVKKIRVGFSNRPYSAFIHLASHKKFFSKNQILHEFPSSTRTMQAFQAGKIDLAFLSMDQIVTMLSQSIDFKIISVIDESMGGDGLVVAPYIKNEDIFKHIKIGLELHASGGLLLSNFMEQYPKKASMIEPLEVKQNAIISAFKQGKIDGAIVGDPTKQMLLDEGAVELFNSMQMQQPITYLLVAHSSILKTNRKSVLKVLTGFYRAEQLYNRDQRVSLMLMSKEMNISVYKLKQLLGHFNFYSIDKALLHLSGAPSQIGVEIKALSQYMFEHDMLRESSINYYNMIDTSTLKEIIYD